MMITTVTKNILKFQKLYVLCTLPFAKCLTRDRLYIAVAAFLNFRVLTCEDSSLSCGILQGLTCLMVNIVGNPI